MYFVVINLVIYSTYMYKSYCQFIYVLYYIHCIYVYYVHVPWLLFDYIYTVRMCKSTKHVSPENPLSYYCYLQVIFFIYLYMYMIVYLFICVSGCLIFIFLMITAEILACSLVHFCCQ